MEKLILFYDDTKPSCCRCISSFQKHENVECRKMSDNQDKTLIFATGAKIGLVFESENGKVPYTVSHIIWRVVADKNQEHMILVTGGKRELKAIETAQKDMDKRGYHTGHIYFRYLLEKYKVKGEEATDRILKDMETNEIRDHVREKYGSMTQEGSSEKPAEGISDLQKISEGSLNMMIGSRGGRI